jgi:diketogulonate reductase-like aldo/keto reductase
LVDQTIAKLLFCSNERSESLSQENTYQLGFGCAKLTHHWSSKGSLKNLHTAFNEGVTHFDVARMYGFGIAENILGKFVQGKRDKLVIASKAGMNPRVKFLKNQFVQQVARKASSLRRREATPFKASNLNQSINLEECQESFNQSLKSLGTEYLDYLFLHEPSLSEAQRDDVLEWLDRLKEKGQIIKYGVAGYYDSKELSTFSNQELVVQTCDNLLDSLPSREGKLFFFSPFSQIRTIRELLENESEVRRRTSDLMGFDVVEHLPRFLMMNTKLHRSSNTLIFSSTRNENIKSNIQAWNSIDCPDLELKRNFAAARNLILDHINDV